MWLHLLVPVQSSTLMFSILGNPTIPEWHFLYGIFLKTSSVIVLTLYTFTLTTIHLWAPGRQHVLYVQLPTQSLTSVCDLRQAPLVIYLIHIYWVPSIFHTSYQVLGMQQWTKPSVRHTFYTERQTVKEMSEMYFIYLHVITQLGPILCDPVDCSPPGSSVHGILQAGILKWVAMPSSGVSSQPRDRTKVSHIAGGFFTVWATRKARYIYLHTLYQIVIRGMEENEAVRELRKHRVLRNLEQNCQGRSYWEGGSWGEILR